MNSIPFRTLKGAAALGIVTVLAACSSAPLRNAAVDDAKASYERAARDTQVARSAPVELQKAQKALEQAESALRAGEETATVEHYAGLSKRRTATAMEAGKIAAADQTVSAAGVQRERILVEVRTRDAEAQRARAQAATADAGVARKQAEEQLARAASASAAAQQADERARKLAAQIEQLKAQKTERGLVLTLGDVLFDTGRADLKPGAMRTLEQLVVFLKENPKRTALIEGHTDSVGSMQYNQDLSERRAMAVKFALLNHGIDSRRITTRGFGPSQPLVSNDNAAGRQQNRRVEIVLPEVS